MEEITPRSDAYFMGTGSRMETALASATAIRHIMTYDNVPDQVATIGLALGGYQVPNITVTTP